MAIPRIRRKGGSEGHDTSHRMNKERHTQKRPDEFGSIQGLRGRCTAGYWQIQKEKEDNLKTKDKEKAHQEERHQRVG